MDVKEASLSDNWDKPECPICLTPFTEPKIMFCGHIVCRVCLITWIEARGRDAGCPLCRHPIFGVQLGDFEMDHLEEYVADNLPTDYVLQAIARGTIELTPNTCEWCENLLCLSRSSPHPNCPGPIDGQNIDKREEWARAIIDDMLHVVQVMVRWADDIKKAIKDTAEEFRGRVEVNEIVALEQDHTLEVVGFCQSQTEELRTVLMTHQRLLQRMIDSRQLVATMLMLKPMHNRVEFMMEYMELLNQSCLQCSQNLRPSLETVV